MEELTHSIYYIVRNLRYPREAMENGDQGKVILIFEVTKDGAIENIVIKQGVCESLSKEAVRLVKEMPKWIPGELKREIVRTKVTIPINFTMDVH